MMNISEQYTKFIQPHSRVFALEIQQTDFVVRTKGSGKADLITPSGARISRIYSCGALTEINRKAKGGGFLRVADPTGVLILYLKPPSPEINTILDTLITPSFVSIIASVEVDNHPGESGFRLILEMVSPVDRSVRDRWILRTAHLTLKRLKLLSSTLSGESGSDDEQKTISRYRTSTRQLQVIAGMAQKALFQVQNVAEEENHQSGDDSSPSDEVAERVMNLVRQHSGPRGVSVLELTGFAGKSGIDEPLLLETIRGLIADDELYQPSSGFVKIL